ncbi:uncharacterized protein LOC127839435 isoform X1 [Dreissena polymorpha]|uniref:uncharacterized protein LOC127839435 isoform X1 n=3 Tax=Dreissena polymorpha TaxID=45954 RepID=UPI0022648092|nr:uncharacterized protein LOC127839435 isoform X1 [Dreissena polymorpha]
MQRITSVGCHSVLGGEFMHLTLAAGSRLNYTQAQQQCMEAGYHDLAVVDSQTEYDRMIEYFKTQYGVGFVLPSDFWIGSFWEYDGTNWTSVWPMCDTVIPVTWAVWDNGEPDSIGIQTCNRIHSTLKYRTYYCYGLYDALCEKSDYQSCGSNETSSPAPGCKFFAPCWWTPAKIGLITGFAILAVFFCLCCMVWKCCCGKQTQVGDEFQNEEEDDGDENPNHPPPNGSVHQLPRISDVRKNHNIDESPVPAAPAPKIRSVILRPEDAPWLSPEELSFSARHAYRE